MEEQIAYWGELKLTLEEEGDGYFFYGYGLSSEYNDEKLQILFNNAEESINDFKDYIENEIIKAGGNPEDWTAI